jgi:hypothetical protein
MVCERGKEFWLPMNVDVKHNSARIHAVLYARYGVPTEIASRIAPSLQRRNASVKG